MTGEIVPATKTHALRMAAHVRAAEVREIADAHGVSVVRQLIAEMDRSVVAWAWIVNNEVACMFGISMSNLFAAESYPWFLSTDLVDRHAMAFARACRRLLPELLSLHPKLVGMVDARYELSIRWLRWLGAHVGDPEPWGVAGVPFCHFQIGG